MKTKKQKRTLNRQVRTDRRLGAEPLEGRILMAADMAWSSVDQPSDEQADEKADSAITSKETSSSETAKKPTASKQHAKKTAVSLPKEVKLELTEQTAAQSDELAVSEEISGFDKGPVSATDPGRVNMEEKVNLQDLEDHQAWFGDFVEVFAANEAVFREVMDLGPANVFGDNIARDNLTGRFETGPDLSLEGIGVGESMAADKPVIRWRGPSKQEVRKIGKEMEEKYCNDTDSNKEACMQAYEWQFNCEGTPSNPKPTPVPEETSIWDDIGDAISDAWDWICDFFDTPAPEDMQGDHPLPADLLTDLATATAQAYHDLYNLHEGGDGRNPEYNPLAALVAQAYSRQDLEDAVSIGGGGGCGQDDEGTTIDPNSLRRTFTLSNTIEGGCMGPDDLF